jgi:hypothetical protein
VLPGFATFAKGVYTPIPLIPDYVGDVFRDLGFKKKLFGHDFLHTLWYTWGAYSCFEMIAIVKKVEKKGEETYGMDVVVDSGIF